MRPPCDLEKVDGRRDPTRMKTLNGIPLMTSTLFPHVATLAIRITPRATIIPNRQM